MQRLSDFGVAHPLRVPSNVYDMAVAKDAVDDSGREHYASYMPWTAEQIHDAAQRRLRNEAQRHSALEKCRSAARTHSRELVQRIAEV